MTIECGVIISRGWEDVIGSEKRWQCYGLEYLYN